MTSIYGYNYKQTYFDKIHKFCRLITLIYLKIYHILIELIILFVFILKKRIGIPKDPSLLLLLPLLSAIILT